MDVRLYAWLKDEGKEAKGEKTASNCSQRRWVKAEKKRHKIFRPFKRSADCLRTVQKGQPIKAGAVHTRSRNEPPPYLKAISNVRFKIWLFETDIKYGGSPFRDRRPYLKK